MVQSLLVFVCDSSYQALEYAAWSSQFTFLTRCFILTSERLDVKKLNWRKDSDIFLNLNNIINSKDKMDICIRGALMYSSPKYQNILMLKDSNYCDEESLTKTINYLNEKLDFVKNKDLIGFTREYVVLNDTNFIETINQNQKQDEYDEISLGLEVSNALMGLEVDTAPFCEAIKEITSIENIKIHTGLIKNIIKYQEIIDMVLSFSINSRTDLISLYIIDENHSEDELTRIKRELTKEGMILYFTMGEEYPPNSYKIILHKNGTKAILFR